MKKLLLLAAYMLVSGDHCAVSAMGSLSNERMCPGCPNGKVDLQAPARRMADGHPDLQGFWLPVPLVKYLLNLAADMKEDEIPLQPWARALYRERIDNNGKDHPGVRCLPSGIPEKDNIPDGLKIVQTPDLFSASSHDSNTINAFSGGSEPGANVRHAGACKNNCTTNAQCKTGQYCSKVTGDCNGRGACATRPQIARSSTTGLRL